MNDPIIGATPRGFPLPHKENIARQDVMRIRESLEKIDEDLSTQEQAHEQLKNNVDKQVLEQFLNFWNSPYDNQY
jgi:6-pyruvoyl-tetrahydropterin synthase